jgi:hypothetical protein
VYIIVLFYDYVTFVYSVNDEEYFEVKWCCGKDVSSWVSYGDNLICVIEECYQDKIWMYKCSAPKLKWNKLLHFRISWDPNFIFSSLARLGNRLRCYFHYPFWNPLRIFFLSEYDHIPMDFASYVMKCPARADNWWYRVISSC